MLAAGQVIAAIAARLSGATDAGTRVYTSRAWPLDPAKDLPAWRVVAADEDIAAQTVHADPLQSHVLEVECRGHVAAVDNLDADLHSMTADAITAIFSLSPPADALAAISPSKVQLAPVQIERVLQAEGQATLGLALLTLRADFRTRRSAPEAFA